MSIEEMSVRFSTEQDNLLRKIAPLAKAVPAFEVEGVIFKGDNFRAAMNFVWKNPSGGDFYVWLQKTGYEILKP